MIIIIIKVKVKGKYLVLCRRLELFSKVQGLETTVKVQGLKILNMITKNHAE